MYYCFEIPSNEVEISLKSWFSPQFTDAILISVILDYCIVKLVSVYYRLFVGGVKELLSMHSVCMVIKIYCGNLEEFWRTRIGRGWISIQNIYEILNEQARGHHLLVN